MVKLGFWTDPTRVTGFVNTSQSRSKKKEGWEFYLIQPNVHVPLWIEMRMNDSSIRVRRFQREKLFSIEYMGYDRDHAMKDYENRVAFQMTR